MSSSFWETANVRDQFKNLHDTLSPAKAMQKELQMLQSIKDGKGYDTGEASIDEFSEFLIERRVNVESQVSFSVEPANALMAKLRVVLEPFRMITHELCPWEEKSAAVRLANKIHKSKRNKRWRKAKRKRIAETIAEKRERFEEADREADEWRAREIAKDIAKRKGHFLPEEDDKFLERVGAAVEEEGQQVSLAADIDAAKDAIATVEQSRKTTENVKT